MKQYRSTVLAAAFGLLALASQGCAPTETGNPPQGSVQLGLTTFSSAPDIAAPAPGSGGLVVDALSLNVTQLSLLPCASTSPSLEASAGAYDLAQASPSLTLHGDQRLCGGLLKLAPGGDAPGAAVHVHGLRTDGSAFEVVSTQVSSVNLQAALGRTFGAKPLLLGFDVGVWFSGVDVHGAHAGADGVARLDSTLNQDLLAAFEARASLSIALYEDSDGDGSLSAAEQTPVATSP